MNNEWQCSTQIYVHEVLEDNWIALSEDAARGIFLISHGEVTKKIYIPIQFPIRKGPDYIYQYIDIVPSFVGCTLKRTTE